MNGNGHAVPVVTLTIAYNQATSQVSVNGPLDNRFLCYTMLEAARETILKRALAQPTTQPAILTLPPGTRLG